MKLVVNVWPGRTGFEWQLEDVVAGALIDDCLRLTIEVHAGEGPVRGTMRRMGAPGPDVDPATVEMLPSGDRYDQDCIVMFPSTPPKTMPKGAPWPRSSSTANEEPT